MTTLNKLILTIIIATSFATQAETFKLPMGTTFRAAADGYDCGSFGPEDEYVNAPLEYEAREISFFQLSADKELNHFLIELTYPSEVGTLCTYGVFFDRNRETKRLDFSYSQLVAESETQVCETTRQWLDAEFSSVAYEASRRGFRYVAITLKESAQAQACASATTRIVFDRR